MAVEVQTSHIQICDANGDPVSGAKIYIYDVATTTPKSVWSDTGLSVSAANPIIADSAGRHAIRYIASGSYKYVVKTSADVTIYERDNVDGRVPVGSGALAIANGGTSATTAGAALTALGAASEADVTDLAADVAALAGAAASVEKTHIATGTTAQRPASPAEGDIRRNTTSARWEGYDGSWEQFITDSEVATQTQMEAASSNAVYASPGSVKWHPGVAKAWAYVTFSAGTPSIITSHNVTSIADNGNGLTTLTFTTAFSAATFAAIVSADPTGASASSDVGIEVIAKATTTVQVSSWSVSVSGANTTRTASDMNYSIVCYGDQ